MFVMKRPEDSHNCLGHCQSRTFRFVYPDKPLVHKSMTKYGDIATRVTGHEYAIDVLQSQSFQLTNMKNDKHAGNVLW